MSFPSFLLLVDDENLFVQIPDSACILPTFALQIFDR